MRRLEASSRWAMLVVLAACPLAERAHAQAAPGPESAAGLQEIVVTAEKRSESVNDVPMSIDALTADQLLSSGINSTDDLAKVVPGFSSVTNLYGSSVYYLRGVGYYDTSIAARPAVTIYADEAPIPYSVMAMGTTLDLERVEVLKGPQGTLFGSNSTGGAINFVAAKPTDTLQAGVDASYGRFSESTVSGFISGPINDTIKARLAVSHDGSGDWQYNYLNGQGLGQKDITSFRGTLDIRPMDKLSVLLTLSGTLDGSDVQTGQLVAKNPNIAYTPVFAAFPLAPDNARATAFGGPLPFGAGLQKDDTELQATVRINYDLTDDIAITSLSSWARNTQSYGLAGSATDLQVDAFDHQGDVRSLSEELRLTGTYDQMHWIFGGNIEHDDTHESTAFGIAQAATGQVFNFLGLPPTDNVPTILNTIYDSDAVFGNVDYDVLDSVTAHVGARYTDTHTSYDQCSEAAGNLTYAKGIVDVLNATSNSDITPRKAGDCFVFAPLPNGGYTPTVAAGSVDQGSMSFRAGLDWKPIDKSMVYANISRGFKSAAISDISAVFVSQVEPVPEEELTAYEVGVKSDIIPRTHFDAAFFYYDYKDKQLQGTEVVPVFGALEALVNIPKSHIDGADFDISTRPIPALSGLSLGAQATFVQSTVESSYIGTTALGGTANFEGSQFPNTPKWEAGANIDYTWEVGENLNAFVGGRMSYRSRTNGDFLDNPLLAIPSYTLFDAYAGVRSDDDTWSVQLWGHNITNRYYWTSQVVNQEAIVRYAGMPATYGVSLSYRFGKNPAPAPAEAAVAPAPEAAPPPPAPAAVPEAQRQFQVFFDFDKSDITDAAAKVIQAAADAVKSGNIVQVTVTGHTDTVGSAAYNMALSQRRAAAIKAAMVADGVNGGEIATIGAGKTGLLVPTADGVREPQNRRAEIVLK